MIVATSGSTNINFNRIISSASYPYSIQVGTQSYTDSISSNNREIKALYIASLTSVLSLVYDNSLKLTDLASIDFSSTPAKISYKRTFPFMDIGGLTTGVFVSPTVFYVGSYGSKFYQSSSSSTF